MSNNFKEFVKGLPKVFPDKIADKETLSYDRDKTTHQITYLVRGL